MQTYARHDRNYIQISSRPSTFVLFTSSFYSRPLLLQPYTTTLMKLAFLGLNNSCKAGNRLKKGCRDFRGCTLSLHAKRSRLAQIKSCGQAQCRPQSHSPCRWLRAFLSGISGVCHITAGFGVWEGPLHWHHLATLLLRQASNSQNASGNHGCIASGHHAEWSWNSWLHVSHITRSAQCHTAEGGRLLD